jgi:hypothetical protein
MCVRYNKIKQNWDWKIIIQSFLRFCFHLTLSLSLALTHSMPRFWVIYFFHFISLACCLKQNLISKHQKPFLIWREIFCAIKLTRVSLLMNFEERIFFELYSIMKNAREWVKNICTYKFLFVTKYLLTWGNWLKLYGLYLFAFSSSQRLE